LPLTLSDALAHAGRFPLALVWTAVPQGTKAYALASRIGISLKYKRTKMAALIVPTAYLPPSFSCPELTNEGLCGIHGSKPLRCRTMPFYPYREESEQADLLLPQQGWACDTSQAAAAVYRNKLIVDRADFNLERNELLQQAPIMQKYAEYMLKYSPWIVENLAALLTKPGGNVITSLSSFMTAIKHLDAANLAAQQVPLLKRYAEMTAEIPALAEYHRNYAGWTIEMEYLASVVGHKAKV
jgi:Fe-S-cluster containining protein